MSKSKIVIKRNPALTFNEEGHIYRKDGDLLPSVTQINKSAGYDKDLEAVPEDILEAGTARGANTHKATELLDRGTLDWPHIKNQSYYNYVQAYALFKKHHVKEVVEIELMLDADNFAGTFDRLIINKKKELVLLELKASREVRESVGIQCGGYELLLKHQGIVPDKVWVLHLQPLAYNIWECNKRQQAMKMFATALDFYYSGEGYEDIQALWNSMTKTERRMCFKHVKQGDIPLSPEQRDRLLALIKRKRELQKSYTEYNNVNKMIKQIAEGHDVIELPGFDIEGKWAFRNIVELPDDMKKIYTRESMSWKVDIQETTGEGQ